MSRSHAGLVLVLLLATASLHSCVTTGQEAREPVSLDSKDPRYADYLAQLRKMIMAKWGYPCVKDEATGRCEYRAAKLVIVISLFEDGRVARVEVQKTSGYGIYDEYAMNAINAASPFPPVPPALMAKAEPGSTGVRIVAAFNYVLESPRELLR